MAAEHELTPSSYIGHHLSFLQHPVGQGSFWTLNVDSLVTAFILGVLGTGFLWWVVRGATSGVPNKRQAFVELAVDFVSAQVNSIYHGESGLVAPMALTTFVLVLMLNAMDFLPVDIAALGTHAFASHWRLVPTADINTTAALALSVFTLMIIFSIRAKGLFGWLTAAPWGNPAFSGFMLSLVIFGFGGGITGVTLGTQQINIMAHNTLRIPGHFHLTVVGGTTLAFMALTYYVVPLIFQREFYARALCRIQPWLFGIGIVLVGLGMSFAGSYGVPRRHWDVEFTGAQFATGFDSGAHVMLGVVGIGAVVAFLGLLLYILLVVAAVFFGRRNAGQAMTAWHTEPRLPQTFATEGERGAVAVRVPGSLALALIFLACFAVFYFANWLWLSDAWHVR